MTAMKWALYIGGGLVLLVGIVALIGALLPQGHVASRMARYRQSPAAIWSALVDIEAYPSWRSDLEKVELLPARDGHPMWRETVDRQPVLMERMEEVPEQRMVGRIADTTLPFGGYWIYELRPDGEGSALTITERGEVYNPIFRFVNRFIMGQGTSLERYLRDLGGKLGEQVEPRPAEPGV
jgi:hypothetical protein